MSKVNVVRRCYNCGAILQSRDPDKDGYIPSQALEGSSLNAILFCEHCFRESHFNAAPLEASVSPDFLTMLLDAKASDALIVYLVDLFSFECSFNAAISKTIQSLPLLVIANKRDLMPAEAKDEDLREYVAHRFRVASLPVQKEDVVLVSLTSFSDLSSVAALIEEKRRRHDVYIIGATGAGKTYFLSSYLRNYHNKSSQAIVTTNYPSTHLRVIQIPLDSSSMIYDTPGTGIENSLLGQGDALLARALMPKASLKPREFLMEEGSSLFLGGLARLDLLSTKAKRNPLIAYCSSDVEIRRYLKKDLDGEWKKNLEKKILKPASSLVTSLLDMDVFDFEVVEEGRRDIGIAGLGWFSFTGAQQTFRLYVPKGVGVYGSRAKVK